MLTIAETINIASKNITVSTESTHYRYLVYTSFYFWSCYRGLVSRDRGEASHSLEAASRQRCRDRPRLHLCMLAGY